MSIFDRKVRQRIHIVDGYGFSAGARQRLAQRYDFLTDDGLDLVQDATRQWLRVVARASRAELALPSVVVGQLWRELAGDTSGYAQFCQRAFGRFLPAAQPVTISSGKLSGGGTDALLRVLRLARVDEERTDSQLPLLFRVDADLDVPGGRRYLANCGGGPYRCFPAEGLLCLRHVGGVSRRPSRWRNSYREHAGLAGRSSGEIHNSGLYDGRSFAGDGADGGGADGGGGD